MRSSTVIWMTVLAATLPAFFASPGAAQVRARGEVVVRTGPVDLRVVLGPRYDGRYRDRRYVDHYRGLAAVERELDRVEAEYDYYREVRKYHGAAYLGWSEYELDRHIDRLKDERKYLKHERKRLRKLERAERRYSEEMRETRREYERERRDRERDRDRDRRDRRRGRGRG